MQGEATNTSAVRFDARHWWLLALVCGVLFLDGLDVSMVGVALPSIGGELGLEAELVAMGGQRLHPRLRRPVAARRPCPTFSGADAS